MNNHEEHGFEEDRVFEAQLRTFKPLELSQDCQRALAVVRDENGGANITSLQAKTFKVNFLYKYAVAACFLLISLLVFRGARHDETEKTEVNLRKPVASKYSLLSYRMELDKGMDEFEKLLEENARNGVKYSRIRAYSGRSEVDSW